MYTKKATMKTKKITKVLPIRWSEENIAFFIALGYIDQRSNNVNKKKRDYSFNSFINSLVKLHFKDITDINIKKKVKAVLIANIDDEIENLYDKKKEIAKRK